MAWDTAAPPADGRSFLLICGFPSQDAGDVIEIGDHDLVKKVAVAKIRRRYWCGPDGKAAYVSCIGSNQVAEIDATTWKVSRMIATGTDGWISWRK